MSAYIVLVKYCRVVEVEPAAVATEGEVKGDRGEHQAPQDTLRHRRMIYKHTITWTHLLNVLQTHAVTR